MLADLLPSLIQEGINNQRSLIRDLGLLDDSTLRPLTYEQPVVDEPADDNDDEEDIFQDFDFVDDLNLEAEMRNVVSQASLDAGRKRDEMASEEASKDSDFIKEANETISIAEKLQSIMNQYDQRTLNN